MRIELDFQNVSKFQNVPNVLLFKKWMLCALESKCDEAEIVLRVVDVAEMQQLNFTYRRQNKPTNVLAFPLENCPLIGDIVICAALVIQEAKAQNKAITAHWAHLTVHGILHLLGYDHVESEEAEIMESLEIKILNDLGFPNPYGL